MKSAMEQCNFLIVGAGIIGLSVAGELLSRGRSGILILEKELQPGLHASGRNSGFLHAGIYYSADSLKARFCIDGNRLMKEYCRRHNLPLRETGKVIVAADSEQLEGLHELRNRAERNGAVIHLINTEQLAKIEPHASTFETALYSPDTAVIDPVRILLAMKQEIQDSGKARVLMNTAFLKRTGENTVDTTNGPVQFEMLINTAGTYADRVAHEFGVGAEYRIQPFKGTYMQLNQNRSDLVNGNIYSVPDLKNPFLGIHFCKNVEGHVTLGPTAIPALSRENYGFLENLEPETPAILYRDAVLLFRNASFRHAAAVQLRKYSKRVLYAEARRMVPELKLSDLQPSSKRGIRAQLVHWPDKQLVMDFVILQEPSSIHVLNAVSPAFTSAIAFARYVVDKL